MRDFQAAASEVLQFLTRRFGMSLWLVCVFERGKRRALLISDESHGLRPGDFIELPGPPNQGHSLARRVTLRRDVEIDLPQWKARALIEAPILFESGTPFGTLTGLGSEPLPQEIESEASLVFVFANILGWVAEADQGAALLAGVALRASEEARTDSLTGLPNRRAWDDVVVAEHRRCKTRGSAAHVILVDLDKLKEVNDESGHGAGDELLASTAQTLLRGCRKSDYVARLGGDEFGILVAEESADIAQKVRQRIRSALEGMGIRASAGLAVLDSKHGPKAALRAADSALYKEKAAKRKLEHGVVSVETGHSMTRKATNRG